MNQKLVLTPQLQQAIRLLQLSTLELQQEIQHQIETNPLLETISTDDEEEEVRDFQWADSYSTENVKERALEISEKDTPFFQTSSNLQDHLRWQLELTPMTDMDRMIGTALIDAIDEDGFLTLSTTDLHQSLQSASHPLLLAEIETMKHRIQHFEPIGCGSNHLAEALLIQLEQYPPQTPLLQLTKKIIREHMTLLGKHHYPQLMKQYQIDEETLGQILHLILHLNPKPGHQWSKIPPQFITPDLFVRKLNQRWVVLFNPTCLPHLKINGYYASLIQQTKNETDYQFLKNNLQEAHWFLKSIHSRQDTLLKVARYIVDYQQPFIEFGNEYMKPLTLNSVAKALNMHESTISRVTNQKYIYLPRGLFELKYFFSNHITTDIGGGCSTTAVKAMIRKLITSENQSCPLSDNELTTIMNEQGVKIARRTVTNYRKEMGVAPSSQRKVIRFTTTEDCTDKNTDCSAS